MQTHAHSSLPYCPPPAPPPRPTPPSRGALEDGAHLRCALALAPAAPHEHAPPLDGAPQPHRQRGVVHTRQVGVKGRQRGLHSGAQDLNVPAVGRCYITLHYINYRCVCRGPAEQAVASSHSIPSLSKGAVPPPWLRLHFVNLMHVTPPLGVLECSSSPPAALCGLVTADLKTVGIGQNHPP